MSCKLNSECEASLGYINPISKKHARRGGACLYFQQSERGRNMWISEFKGVLVYIRNSRSTRDI